MKKVATNTLSIPLTSEVDPVSVEFIAWAMEQTEDEEWFREFRLDCIRKLKNFLSRDPQELRALLRNKLERGSADHGSPLKKRWDIEKELADEYIDILGWPLVELFRDHYAKRAK